LIHTAGQRTDRGMENGSVTDEATRQALDRLVAAVCRPLPLVSVRARGSLAGGDHRPGRGGPGPVAAVDRVLAEHSPAA
jgi:hypothetical protein